MRAYLATGLFVLAFVAAPLLAVADDPGPREACAGRKLAASAKYASCIASALRHPEQTGDRLVRCLAKLTTALAKAEEAAVSAGDACASTGDIPEFPDFMLGCREAVIDALEGEGLVLAPNPCRNALRRCNSDLTTCSSGAAACSADCSDNMRPPSLTGQTTCSDFDGAEVACAGTSHDGDLQLGAPRSFTNNGDGTITDNVTGLVWEQLTDDGGIHDKDAVFSWADALTTKVSELNGTSFAGHSDWRLPNVNELESIRLLTDSPIKTDAVFDASCTAGCAAAACSCTSPSPHWTSSTWYARLEMAYWVDFSSGQLEPGNKSGSFRVRLVRGGS